MRACALRVLRSVEQMRAAARDALVDGVLDTCLEELGGALNNVKRLRDSDDSLQNMAQNTVKRLRSSEDVDLNGEMAESGVESADSSSEEMPVCEEVEEIKDDTITTSEVIMRVQHSAG